MDEAIQFVVGNAYRRREMHTQYGGQRVGGIATPTSMAAVWLFTGDDAAFYGYNDIWVDAETFRYYGQGQYGDMKFTRGNRAIRDHRQNGESLMLFDRIEDGYVKFLGKMLLVHYDIEKGRDLDNKVRDVIIFTLKYAED